MNLGKSLRLKSLVCVNLVFTVFFLNFSIYNLRLANASEDDCPKEDQVTGLVSDVEKALGDFSPHERSCSNYTLSSSTKEEIRKGLIQLSDFKNRKNLFRNNEKQLYKKLVESGQSKTDINKFFQSVAAFSDKSIITAPQVVEMVSFMNQALSKYKRNSRTHEGEGSKFDLLKTALNNVISHSTEDPFLVGCLGSSVELPDDHKAMTFFQNHPVNMQVFTDSQNFSDKLGGLGRDLAQRGTGVRIIGIEPGFLFPPDGKVPASVASEDFKNGKLNTKQIFDIYLKNNPSCHKDDGDCQKAFVFALGKGMAESVLKSGNPDWIQKKAAEIRKFINFKSHPELSDAEQISFFYLFQGTQDTMNTISAPLTTGLSYTLGKNSSVGGFSEINLNRIPSGESLSPTAPIITASALVVNAAARPGSRIPVGAMYYEEKLEEPQSDVRKPIVGIFHLVGNFDNITAAQLKNTVRKQQGKSLARSILPLLEGCLASEGIYREAGSQSKILATLDKLVGSEEKKGLSSEEPDCHDRANVFKRLIRESDSSDTLLTQKMMDGLKEAQEKSPEAFKARLKEYFKNDNKVGFKSQNKEFLKEIFVHLAKAAAPENSEKSKMTPLALGVVFAPTLIQNNDIAKAKTNNNVLTYMIANSSDVLAALSEGGQNEQPSLKTKEPPRPKSGEVNLDSKTSNQFPSQLSSVDHPEIESKNKVGSDQAPEPYKPRERAKLDLTSNPTALTKVILRPKKKTARGQAKPKPNRGINQFKPTLPTIREKPPQPPGKRPVKTADVNKVQARVQPVKTRSTVAQAFQAMRVKKSVSTKTVNGISTQGEEQGARSVLVGYFKNRSYWNKKDKYLSEVSRLLEQKQFKEAIARVQSSGLRKDVKESMTQLIKSHNYDTLLLMDRDIELQKSSRGWFNRKISIDTFKQSLKDARIDQIFVKTSNDQASFGDTDHTDYTFNVNDDRIKEYIKIKREVDSKKLTPKQGIEKIRAMILDLGNAAE